MRSVLFFLLIGAACVAHAQSALYRSYEEYAQQRGEPVDRITEVVPSMGRFVVLYSKDGTGGQLPVRKLWGFMNRGVLYRMEQQDKLPVRLMAQGAIYYWENGFAHLHMQRDSTVAAGFEQGHAAYLSRDVQSTIVPAVFKADDTKSASAQFKAAWPAYRELLDRIGEGNDLDRVRQLVADYEVAVEEGRTPGP